MRGLIWRDISRNHGSGWKTLRLGTEYPRAYVWINPYRISYEVYGRDGNDSIIHEPAETEVIARIKAENALIDYMERK